MKYCLMLLKFMNLKVNKNLNFRQKPVELERLVEIAKV